MNLLTPHGLHPVTFDSLDHKDASKRQFYTRASHSAIVVLPRSLFAHPLSATATTSAGSQGSLAPRECHSNTGREALAVVYEASRGIWYIMLQIDKHPHRR